MNTLETQSRLYFSDLRSFCVEYHSDFLNTIGNRRRKPIRVEFRGETIGLIPLTRNMYSLVDPENIDFVSDRLWRYVTWGKSKIGYAQGNTTEDGIKFRTISLHAFLFRKPEGMITDHKNCCGLDNRSDNIRFCTYRQNGMNQKHQQGCSSIYKGVYWNKSKQSWMSHIKKGGTLKNLGYYKDEIEAARAYDRAAINSFGEFARINFPESSPTIS